MENEKKEKKSFWKRAATGALKASLPILKPALRWWFKLKVEGIEKLSFSEPAIVMPNHTSLLDAVLLALFLPEDIHFVVNAGIAKRFEILVSVRKHKKVDPMSPYSVRDMVKTVKSGTPLCLFPEGRITVSGGLMKVYPGIAYIALKTGARLYPISINGLERSKLSYMGKKNKTVLRPETKISVGEPFCIEQKQGVSMRVQKKSAARAILKVMQKELFQSRAQKGVNLFNETVDASEKFGSSYIIAEEKDTETGITQKMAYKRLLISAHIFADKLKAPLAGQKSVGSMLPNALGHLIALLALFKMGKTPVMLNFSTFRVKKDATKEEAIAASRTILDACETASVKTILTSKKFVKKGSFQPLIDVLSDTIQILYLEDIKDSVTKGDKLKGALKYLAGEKSESLENEVVLFTSGSESKPKGVVLTHDNLYANIQQGKAIIDFTQQDKILNALPMFHSFGLTAGTLLPIVCGVCVNLFPSPLAYKAIPEVAYDAQATIIFGTSTFLAGYGKNAEGTDFRAARYVFAGAEKLKDEVRAHWSREFGIRIMEGYGITETAPILALNTPLFCKEGSVGQIVPGVEWKLEPVPGVEKGGNLLVKGPNVMKGYLIHGEGFRLAPEWYDTGDVVEIDEQGFVFIKSRLKRFAKIAGEMVSLNKVEEIAEACYGASEVAAINANDERKGEKIILFTTKKDAKIEAYREYAGANGIAALWIPSKIEIIDKIPLLGSGKTDYVELKKRFGE